MYYILSNFSLFYQLRFHSNFEYMDWRLFCGYLAVKEGNART